jgi:hypothetical protein
MRPEWFRRTPDVDTPRQRDAGEEVWRLTHPDGRVQTCELRNDSRVDGGWDVLVRHDGELLFSKRCVDERGARYVAQAFKQELVRTGWSEASTS